MNVRMMTTGRRQFLGGLVALGAAGGCRGVLPGCRPNLRFGVVSDIHLTTPKSCRLLERSFRQFKRRGVDAVMIPGDLTDWGLRSSLVYLKRTWDKVFAGTEVVPLFCTGNHDFEGWQYGDMAAEMRANGYSESENIVGLGMKACWESVFGEKYASVRVRTVKGYDFISGEYRGYGELAKFMDANGGRFAGTKPFFYFQHLPLKGTTVDSHRWADDGSVAPVLAKFPNCIAFTGHTHRPFLDERSIWQDAFTIVNVPSLSYAGLPGDQQHENGSGRRDGKATQTMPVVPVRRDLRGGQGYIVDVWDDAVVIERRDLEEDASDCPDWTIPLPACTAGRPYAYATRENAEPVPEFPAGAKLELETRNTENRRGFWTIVLDCRFPTAEVPSGSRVFDYEIRAVPQDGSAPMVKYFYSPAYPKLAKYEPVVQRFWFDVAELPQDRDYVVEVRARNCFGKCGRPLVSSVWHSVSETKKGK